MVKRFSAFFLVGLMSLVFLVGIIPAKTEAADENLDKLCVPTYSDLGDDKWRSDSFTYEFINRFEIKVTYNARGKCKSPSGQDSKQLHQSGLDFAGFVNTTLFLGTMTNDDGAFTGERERVVYMTNAADRSGKDETIIEVKHWESGNGIDTQAEKETWDTYVSQATSDIDKMFNDSEYTLGIEEDLLKGAATCDGQNSNVHLVNQNDDGKGVRWICDNNSFNKRGANVLNTIKNKDFFNIGFKYQEDKIVALGTKKAEFTFAKCGEVYRNDSCNGSKTLKISADELNRLKTGKFYTTLAVNEGGKRVFDIGVAEAANATIDPSKTANGVAGAANDDPSTVGEDDSCEANGGALGWLLCPVLTLMSNAIEKMDDAITNLLTVKESYYTDAGIKATAVRLRNVAYTILIPIMLVMVIGTALGFEVVSAYTVKKSLPRLVIAVIFMALAYPICVFLIQMTNDVGGGISNLITSLVDGADTIKFKELFKPSTGNAGVGAVAAVSGAGIALAFGSIGILFSYLFVALMGILVGFLLLSFRQFLIVALMLLAPLAILSWIFPSNDKLWKIWWGTFSKLLLLFPLIMVLIASGKAFAKVVEVSSESGTAATLIKIVAYVGPYFLIPSMFKFAGGIFANVAGIANDRNKGLFDRQKKYRGRKMGENFAKTRNYSRFSDKTRLGRGLNTALGAGFNPKDVARGRAGIKAGMQTGRTNQGAAALKDDATFQAWQNDDKFLMALSDPEIAQQMLDEAKLKKATAATPAERQKAAAEVDARERAMDAARRINSRNSVGTRQAALMALAKTGYQFAPGEEGYQQLSKVVDNLSGGDQAVRAAMMNEAQYHLKNAGRFDLGGINDGAGYSVESGLKKASLYALANGKTDSIKAAGAEHVDFTGPLTQSQLDAASVHYKELEAMKPNATGGNRDEIVRQMEVLESRGIGSHMAQASGRIDPATGLQRQIATRENYVAGAAGWSADEQARGWRTVMRNETKGDLASRQARAYERPDPNNM